jgi:hypothetical protein
MKAAISSRPIMHVDIDLLMQSASVYPPAMRYKPRYYRDLRAQKSSPGFVNQHQCDAAENGERCQ